MAKKHIPKVEPWRTEFKFKVGDKVIFWDEKLKGVITELEQNPNMKPYVFKVDDKEYYAYEEQLKLAK